LINKNPDLIPGSNTWRSLCASQFVVLP